MDGGHIIVWDSNQQDGSGFGIYAQRYDASGNPSGAETRINTTTVGDQILPSVAVLSDGGYVVTWSSYDQDGYGIYAQRYDANGNAMGGEGLINTTTANGQEQSSVAALRMRSLTARHWSSDLE